MLKLSLAAISLVLTASTAVMATDADELKKSGLTGHWALDCTKPPTDDNVHVTWSALPNGRVKQTVDRDAKDTRPDPLLSFEVLSATRVEYVIKSDEGLHVMLQVEKDRYRLWYNGNYGLAAGYVQETAYIKNGKTTGNGKETPWYTRCGR